MSPKAVSPLFDVVASSPTRGADGVTYSPHVRIQFSQPLAKHWPLPSISPPLAGSWKQVGRSVLEFRAKGNFVPDAKVVITVPGGVHGVRDQAGLAFASSYHVSFTIAAGSVLRLQQLLAELCYLPVDFVSSATHGARVASHATGLSSVSSVGLSRALSLSTSCVTPRRSKTRTIETLDDEAARPDAILLSPESGSFSWRFSNIPSSLRAAWKPGVNTAAVRGAVMAFESDHGLPADGVAGAQVWSALLQAVALRHVSSSRYDFLEVTTTNPETLYVWSDGKVIYQSLANTGIAEAPTSQGTFPVYVRYASTTMSGYNPNGSHYDDPGVPYVAYFNGGDAVHGFLRAQYGFPQSLGCVELPYANAAVVFNDDPIGTLVNVS